MTWTHVLSGPSRHTRGCGEISAAPPSAGAALHFRAISCLRLFAAEGGVIVLQRLLQAELNFATERAHLPPRRCGQCLFQLSVKAKREPFVVGVFPHRSLTSVER